MKQKNYIARLYLRLSQRTNVRGIALSIDNRRTLLKKAEAKGFKIHGEYVDDGILGTIFQRSAVQRLLDNANIGAINTIIVKNLSRLAETTSRSDSMRVLYYRKRKFRKKNGDFSDTWRAGRRPCP